jgi:endonuclease-3
MTATKLKASERQAIIQKLVPALRKKYGKKLPENSRPVLESLLFAACLEDAPYEDAEAAYDSLQGAFYDLNEIRVSSISEIEQALGKIPDAEWRALRIRDALQTVFEAHYKFELEHIKRKTHEQALKELSSIRYATPFMKLYVVQQSLGGHVLPLCASSHNSLVWLGLVEPGASLEHAAEDLKTSVRKSDAPVICHLLHSLATDPEYAGCFKLNAQERANGVDGETAVERLNDLFASGGRSAKKTKKSGAKETVTKTRKKPVPKQTASRDKKSTKKPVKKVTKKPAARKR